MSRQATPVICLVEDDPIMGESLCDRFQLEGMAFDWHQTAAGAMVAISSHPYALVISDIRLPDIEGGEMYLQLRAAHRALPPFIFITGYGAIDRAVELLKAGAADYITKPFDLEQLIEKVKSLTSAFAPPAGGQKLGVSQAMRKIEDMLPRLAQHASTILISGESGVGKEHVAQALDRLARKSEKCPFVPVNCGAVTESLFEAELFGYEKGAFTGAARTKKGFFEQADCGTLFLDEISELPASMQVKLLRAIQERRIVRVGGETPIALDLRLYCATNRDLKEMVELGQFREDLFYRINVIQLRIPPLRERKEDILWFARIFLDEFSAKHGGGRRALSQRAEQAFLEYPWPGNIRELRHAIERSCIVSTDTTLGPEAFFGDGLTPWTPPAADGNLSAYLQECERKYIEQALVLNKNHIAHTAESLGISRKNLWEKMRKLGIAGEQG
ncbi:MAG: sigma-54-dependent Fis family transcriptional regulator [Betaproteobacteria bacterium HGW-Betaproteobacteria-14]|nr:MAG: sigma-54-dependent Fis family transcriptional regulator [Betaproteobacteria bacterium HGW-Betaproteobacteria-14]